MIRFRSRTEGLETIEAELIAETLPVMEAAVKDGAVFMEGAVKRKLTGARSGRIYRVPGTKQATYQASAPGEPPAVRLGHLRNSIGHTEPERRGASVSSWVGTALGQGEAAARRAPTDPRSYARILEFGGVAGTTRILPRPWMRPAFKENEALVMRRWEGML